MACTSHVCNSLPVGRQVKFLWCKLRLLCSTRSEWHTISIQHCALDDFVPLNGMIEKYHFYNVDIKLLKLCITIQV